MHAGLLGCTNHSFGIPVGIEARDILLNRARKQLQLALQSQAVQLGIIADADDGAEEPVSLEAFRARKAAES